MVEQRPFKALVAGSSPAQPTICMAWVYILRGARPILHWRDRKPGAPYRGASARQQSHNASVRRANQLVVAKELGSMTEARNLERTLKGKKNPRLAISILQSAELMEQPRKLSGLVPGSSPGRPKFSHGLGLHLARRSTALHQSLNYPCRLES